MENIDVKNVDVVATVNSVFDFVAYIYAAIQEILAIIKG